MVDKVDVREGYKMTELGIIPEDWRVVRFESAFKFLSSGNNSRNDLRDQGTTNYIHYGDIHTKWDNILDCDKESIPFIDSDKVKRLPKLENGDLIIADASEDYDGIGKCVEIKNIKEREIISGLHTFLLRGDKDIFIDGFKGYIQEIKSVKNNIIKITTGTSVYGISKRNFRNILIPAPPLEEQKAIAQALTDTDKLIHSIEKLIDKKEKIKQGTMQELLTGKKRLDGFSGDNTVNIFKNSEIGGIPKDWICIELNTIISNFRLGGNYGNSEKQSPYPLIKMGNLDRGKIKLNKVEYINDKKRPSNIDKLKYGDLLFNTRNTLSLVGKTSIWRDELPLAYYNSNILRLEFKSEYINSSFFMNYVLNMKNSIAQLRNFATGTTSVAAIYTKDLLKLKVAIPSNIEEQKAISQILSDMDQEIQSLEQKQLF